MKLFGRAKTSAAKTELAGAAEAALAAAIKDAQLKAFGDGWIEGCDTGMRMILGEGPPDTKPYTGEVPHELRVYVMESLTRLAVEKAAR